MELRRAVLLMVIGAALALSAVPGRAEEKGKEEKKDAADIWREVEQTGRRRFELTDDEIGRIMKWVKEKNPEKLKELEELRKNKEEAAKFVTKLREYAKDEYDKVIRERFDKYRKMRREDFLDWLKKEYEWRAKELDKVKSQDPKLYDTKFQLVWDKYRRIYEAWRWNPELGKVLKQDMALKHRRDGLVGKLKNEKDDKKKRELAHQLWEVVGDRFDLIIRRKQIAYDQLLKRLDELKKQINDQRNEIKEWRGDKFQEGAMRVRIKELLEGTKFEWN